MSTEYVPEQFAGFTTPVPALNGWRKGSLPADPEDSIGERCWAQIEPGKRCVRRKGHLHRARPIPHLIVYLPEGAAPSQGYWREVWGAGA